MLTELPVHCGFVDSGVCIREYTKSGAFDYGKMRSPNETGDAGVIDAGIIRRRNQNAVRNAAEKIKSVVSGKKIAFIPSGRGGIKDLPYLAVALDDMGFNLAWSKTEHSEDYSHGYRKNRRLAGRSEFNKMITEADVVAPFDDKVGNKSTGRSIVGVTVYAIDSIKRQSKMVLPVLNIDTQGLVPVANFELYHSGDYSGPISIIREITDEKSFADLRASGKLDMIHDERVNGNGCMELNNNSSRKRIEFCRDALTYSIAHFRGHSEHSKYPITYLNDLRDMLDEFLVEGG